MISIVFFHLYQSCLPVSDLSLRQGCDHRQPRNGHLLPVDRNSIYKIGPFPSTTIFFFLEIITLIVVFFLERSISSFNYTELQGSTTDAITLSLLLQRSLLISHSNICITCGSTTLHQPKHNYIYIYTSWYPKAFTPISSPNGKPFLPAMKKPPDAFSTVSSPLVSTADQPVPRGLPARRMLSFTIPCLKPRRPGSDRANAASPCFPYMSPTIL